MSNRLNATYGVATLDGLLKLDESSVPRRIANEIYFIRVATSDSPLFRGRWAQYLPDSVLPVDGDVVFYPKNSGGTDITNQGRWVLFTAGQQGIDGAPGPAGPPGVGIIPTGEYNNTRTYQPGEYVSYQGGSYVALVVTTGNIPVSGSTWQVIAIPGQDGAPGAPGATGPQGETGPPGAGINPRGEYNNTETYNIGDSVSYEGSSFVAIAITINNLPTNSSFWQLLAQAGVDGINGGPGPQGETGSVSAAESLTLKHITTLTNPSIGSTRIYAKSDSSLYSLNSSGEEKSLTPLMVSENYITSALTENSSELFTLTLGYSGLFISVDADVNCWLIAYTSTSARSSDGSRLINIDPAPGSGVLLEVILNGSQPVLITPSANYFGDPEIYFRVRNLSSSTTPIGLTISGVRFS